MIISVEYFGQLQHITGIRTESIDINPQSDISALLTQLAEKYGDRFRDFVFNGDGSIRKSIPIVIDERQIAHNEKVSFKDGARLMILSPIAGG